MNKLTDVKLHFVQCAVSLGVNCRLEISKIMFSYPTSKRNFYHKKLRILRLKRKKNGRLKSEKVTSRKHVTETTHYM